MSLAEVQTQAPVDEKDVEQKIRSLILQKDYPCIGALRAVKKNEYRVGVYEGFGTGVSRHILRKDLLTFLEEQKFSGSPYLTFWASYPHEKESSALDTAPWDKAFSSDSRDKNFCFSLAGSAFFVVGLHKNSSRMVGKYGDHWEAIQFSGKNNDEKWKCPFHRLLKKIGG